MSDEEENLQRVKKEKSVRLATESIDANQVIKSTLLPYLPIWDPVPKPSSLSW